MATAADYGVDFGYGAQDGYWYGPNGKVGRYHRGNDRPTGVGIPIVIGSSTIGWTGKTGVVSGPHLHTQAMKPGTNIDVNPGPYEFQPGTVVDAGWHNQFGNYVTVQTNGINLIYAHLNSINVSVGQQVGQQAGGDEMIANVDEARLAYRLLRGNGHVSDGELNGTAGRRSWVEFARTAQAEVDSRERGRAELEQHIANQQNVINQLNQAITELKNVDAVEDQQLKELVAQLQTAHETIKQLKETEPTKTSPLPQPDPVTAKNSKPTFISKLIYSLLTRKKK